MIAAAAGNAILNPDGLSLGLAILRVAVGVIMLAHGINHIWRGGKIQGTAGWFASLGMKPGILHAWLASLTELGAGALLIVGFLTPLAAAGVVGTMTVALITNHLQERLLHLPSGRGLRVRRLADLQRPGARRHGSGQVVARQRCRVRLGVGPRELRHHRRRRPGRSSAAPGRLLAPREEGLTLSLAQLVALEWTR